MLLATIRVVTAKGLTETWNGAMAAKPSDWTLRGAVCGPREADPAIRGSGWVAGHQPAEPDDGQAALLR